MATAAQFAANMRKRGQQVRDNLTKRMKVTAVAVDTAVVMATPVDEGRARSNWQVTLDSAVTTPIEPFAPGKDGSTAGINSQTAIDTGKTTISQYDPKLNKEIHITNNLPYIRRLNDGWSAQAPINFVEEAVAVGVAAGEKVKLLEG